MIDEAKYLVVEAKGTETPILFPCWMNHSEIAGARKVVSAGRVRFSIRYQKIDGDGQYYDAGDVEPNIRVSCFGQSIMKDKSGNPIKSRPEEDAALIQKSIIREEQ